MKEYLLDTDILIDFFQKKTYALDLIKHLKNTGKILTSILTITELCSGWSESSVDSLLADLYKSVKCQGVTQNIAELAGKMRYKYKTRGQSLSVIDTIIAATAIVNDHTLVTRNQKDYPMPQIKLYQFT